MNFLRIAFATLLLAIAFAAFFPYFAVGVVGDLTGVHTIGLSVDDKTQDVLWFVGAAAFFVALRFYMTAFTQ